MSEKKKHASSANSGTLGHVLSVDPRPLLNDRAAQEAIAEERISERQPTRKGPTKGKP